MPGNKLDDTDLLKVRIIDSLFFRMLQNVLGKFSDPVMNEVRVCLSFHNSFASLSGHFEKVLKFGVMSKEFQGTDIIFVT